LPLLHACKMRAHGSSQAGGCRTAQHDGTALTCENTTNRSQATQGVTDPVLLLICGFGVQVPGGAPCLTWPFELVCRRPKTRRRPNAGKCVREASSARTHRGSAESLRVRIQARTVQHGTACWHTSWPHVVEHEQTSQTCLSQTCRPRSNADASPPGCTTHSVQGTAVPAAASSWFMQSCRPGR
jgi:hypothetical protein